MLSYLQKATILPNDIINIINDYCQNEIYYTKHLGQYGYYFDGEFFNEDLPYRRCHSAALINNVYCRFMQDYMGTLTLCHAYDNVIQNYTHFGPSYINKIIVTNYIYIDYLLYIHKYSVNADFTLVHISSLLTKEKLTYANNKYIFTSRYAAVHLTIYDTNFNYINLVPFKCGYRICRVNNCLVSYDTANSQIDSFDLDELL
jgi:hypothetical protein